VLCTAVPNTLAFFDTPKAAKSLMTLRTLWGDDGGDEGGDCVKAGRGLILGGGEREGVYKEPMGYEWRERCCLDWRYLSVNRVPCTYKINPRS